MADADPPLMLAAWRYAAGDLPAAEAEAFAARLGYDFAAQQALAEAVRRSALACGRETPTPDPRRREAVRRALRGERRAPLAWASAGAAAAVLLVGLSLRLAEGPAAPPPEPALTGLPPGGGEWSLRVRLPGDGPPPAGGGFRAGRPTRPAALGGE